MEIKMNALVIDDETAIRNLMARALTHKGFTVDTAADGEEGIEKAGQKAFDLVLTDLKMPKMNGIETLEAIKAKSPLSEVIVITGHGSVTDAVDCMKLGAYDFITKPLDITELQAKARRAVERTRLKKKIGDLEELNKVKSEFLANMSHELRTPLSAVMGYISLILDGVYGQVAAEQKDALTRADTNARELLQMINEILDFAKLKAAKMPVYVETFDMSRLLRETADSMRALSDRKGLILNVYVPEKLHIASDRTKVKQVLVNLISNAFKYTDTGEVTVGLRTTHDGGIEMRVRDTGIGISKENQKKVFDEFQQVDGSSTRERGGTGLGLAITQRFIELLGGTIRLESIVGKGSDFIVRLPSKSDRKDAVANDFPMATKGAGKRKTLLAIDNNPEILRIIRDSLSGGEYAFLGSDNGPEGLALARRIRPAVITLDIMMPNMDGWSLLQKIKADPDLRDIPVFVVSIVDNKALGFSLGAAEYLVKPFDRAALLEKLEDLEQNNRKRVLVVDDEEGVADFLRCGLENLGCQVKVAHLGKDALRLITKDKPDVLFLDLNLPDMSGLDVLTKIEQDPALSGIRIVIVTGTQLGRQELKALRERTHLVVEKGGRGIPALLDSLKEGLGLPKKEAS